MTEVQLSSTTYSD